MMLRKLPASQIFLALAILLCAAVGAHAQTVNDRRTAAARDIAKNIAQLDVHKLYLPDACDANQRPHGPSAYFAATFSQLLGANARGFAVLPRSDVHRFLLDNHWTDCDVVRAEVIAQLASQFGLDAILNTQLSPQNGEASIDFVVRDRSGKELLRSNYVEARNTWTVALFPAMAAPAGWPFYFAGLDGITMPKAREMKPPSYPGGKGNVSGKVILSAVVTTDGRIEQARVMQALAPDADQAALDVTKTWRFEPAKMPDGAPVTVRLPFEANFAVY
ncbi:MAG TPA: energy transducer TonB [Candidatus Sulfotelmatobacter sp.]|nr:energy transducer TonB [Candidatus Sulfotelmatobacter sp.]